MCDVGKVELTKEGELESEEEVERDVVGFCLGEEEEGCQVEKGYCQVWCILVVDYRFHAKKVLTAIT